MVNMQKKEELREYVECGREIEFEKNGMAVRTNIFCVTTFLENKVLVAYAVQYELIVKFFKLEKCRKILRVT